MLIYRDKPQFRPITIVLETQEDAEKFISIIDKVDAWHTMANLPPKLTKEEREMVITISDHFTNMVGYRK